MVSKRVNPPSAYPYLAPNLFSASILMVDVALTMVFLEESLEGAKEMPSLGNRMGNLFAWLWQFTSSTRPSYLRRHPGEARLPHLDSENPDGREPDDRSDAGSHMSLPTMFPQHTEDLKRQDVFNRDTVLLLASYLIFQFSNVSFNSLFPIFAQAPVPTGRNLSPTEIGLSLSFAGIVTIAFQIGIFGKLRDKLGNKATYRWSFAGFSLAFLMMPWVGYRDDAPSFGIGKGKGWLWSELCVVLLIKTVATVGGLTSALLLVCLIVPIRPLDPVSDQPCAIDHQLCAESQRPRDTQRPGPVPVSSRTRGRTSTQWRALLPLHACEAQG